MANDRDRQREHQAARLSPDFLWEWARRLHKIGEGKAGWGHGRYILYLHFVSGSGAALRQWQFSIGVGADPHLLFEQRSLLL